ncbi:hypothetical protein NLI96_g12949 [Meripilus lineatus]|uniref:Uncharacterized protein n=1 Tax=Meripilus lineatus TaxID=2056292 RepID=A0AAD5UNY9_9APHY|nr:hypothetical protein NLI96_g12949 [Physisporinus lineatus]
MQLRPRASLVSNNGSLRDSLKHSPPTSGSLNHSTSHLLDLDLQHNAPTTVTCNVHVQILLQGQHLNTLPGSPYFIPAAATSMPPRESHLELVFTCKNASLGGNTYKTMLNLAEPATAASPI